MISGAGTATVCVTATVAAAAVLDPNFSLFLSIFEIEKLFWLFPEAQSVAQEIILGCRLLQINVVNATSLWRQSEVNLLWKKKQFD